MNTKQVMERNVLHAGKTFVKEGEEHSRAYIIQTGKVRAFRMESGAKIVLKTYGPNTIIGEANLFEDRIADKSFEAVTDTTVITITRHEFEKRLQKTDSIIQTVFLHLMEKLQTLKMEEEIKNLKALEIDEGAFQLVRDMIKGISEDQRRKYELAMLPHVNELVKSVNRIKAGEE